MIFTAIRKFTENNYTIDVYCYDLDFETALSLTKTYLQHSIIMFNNLPKQSEQDVFKSGQNKKQFLDALPNQFQRKDAVELAIKFNMKERTTDAFLKSCLGKYLNLKGTGIYEKI